MDAERQERLRRRARWRQLTAIAGAAFAMLGHVTRHSAILPYAIPVAVLAGVVVVVSLFMDWRTKQRIAEGRDGDRWPLGEPYQVEFQRGRKAGRLRAELHVGTEDLTLLVHLADPVRVALTDVAAVRVRRTGIDVETQSETLVLVPANYSDRERLLWELAVRCPDAMERGMDEDAAPRKSALSPPPTTVAPAPDDPAPGPTGLALGSALAGPIDRGNPAPPRKSGLGVGLFVPPPGSGPEPPK